MKRKHHPAWPFTSVDTPLFRWYDCLILVAAFLIMLALILEN
jgi:hypothetical protein